MNYYRPSFGRITPVVKYLLIINIAIYLAMVLIRPLGDLIFQYMFLWFPGSENFYAWQFVTCMFVHFPDGSSIFSKHLFFNMFALFMFGSMVEMVWKGKRFLNFYLVSGIGASVVGLLVMYFFQDSNPMTVMGGASGAIYGILVASAYLFPNNTVYIYFMLPIKIKYLVILLIGIDLFMGLSGRHTGTAHWAHLGGALVGVIFCYGGIVKRWLK